MNPTKKSRANPYFSRLLLTEKQIAKNRQGNFVSKGSRGEALILEIFKQRPEKISLPGLISVTKVISMLIGVKLRRADKRRKALIIKWYNDNESLIEQIKLHIMPELIDPEEECDGDLSNINLSYDELDSDHQNNQFVDGLY